MPGSIRARTLVVVAAAAVAASVLSNGIAAAGTKLLRFPDVHGDRVVFTYAGDLWTASTSGGTAVRLTAHPGLELFAKFSPDGRTIAFTGQYDGDEQVYVIPADGGVPRQLTFYPARGPLPPRWGYDHQVHGWTRDGKAVLFRSMRDGWSLTDTRLYTVPVAGGLPEPLPMPVSGAGDLSPDGRRVAYSPLTRDFRTWKRYQGGWAQDLYIFDLDSHEQANITDTIRTDRDPMWIGDRVYYASDRTGTLNLWVYDTTTRQTRQLTRETVWDVRWPSRGDDDGLIVYELDGELMLFDTAAETSRPISITVPTDALATRPEHRNVARYVEDFALSPKGERALFVARGDVFSAPIENGSTRNLTRSSGAHDKWARWSPDGRSVAFVSDRSGEDEIWLVAQDGSVEPRRLTTGGDVMRYAPEWSPDGSRVAFSDKNGKLWMVDVAGGRTVEIADDRRGQIRDYVWAPGGGHLAFTLGAENGFSSIWIWSAADGSLRRVTSDDFDDASPAWDPNGDYLFYLGRREYAPQIGIWEWNYVGDRATAIFALALRKDVPDPFGPRSDEVAIAAAGASKPAGQKDQKSNGEPAPPIRIDFDGLAERVSRVPVEADDYGALSAVGGYLVYVRGGPFYYGRKSDVKPALMLFSLEDREESTLATGVSGYALARDGSKALVRDGDAWTLYDVKPKGGENKTVSTAGLEADIDPRAEWRQIFFEVWRRYRDFFYVPNMHGYDWNALRERYAAWLPYVAHRSDLNYLIGEMIAELNVGHAYIAGGDYDVPSRPDVALPGATLELDLASGLYRVERVLPGHNQEPKYRSPLRGIGVDVAEGDFLLAIDGETLRSDDNPYRLLRYKADRPVTFTVARGPKGEGRHDVTFTPVASEADLHYLDMVTRNRRRVDEMSGGRVGYLHVPNMGADGIAEFIKNYYPQIRKQGLVVDVRNNGGGNVSQMLIERLSRKLLAVRFSRNNDDAGTYPASVFHGPMACVLNEDSASDGDIFPAMFRQAGLGPLVGRRSWGGVTGITNRGTLIDGGGVFVPEFGFASTDGRWVIEGHGVDPDIEVDNSAKAVLEGRDPQLERAVDEVMKRIETERAPLPPRPAAPVKTE